MLDEWEHPPRKTRETVTTMGPVGYRLFDSHTHINDDAFRKDRHAVIHRALEAGVVRMTLVGYNPRTIRQAVAMVEEYPKHFVFAASTHPHEASKYNKERAIHLKEVLQHPKAVAVGETGLDYFKDYAPRRVQQDVFRRHLELAAAFQKPVILHLRDAWEDAFQIMEEFSGDLVGGIFHCFTGIWSEASHIVEQLPHFWISFSGILTFSKDSDGLLDVARGLPAERILIETDAPFLTPVPYRGKRNEPAFLIHTFKFLAHLRGVNLEELGRQIWENTHRAYRLPLAS